MNLRFVAASGVTLIILLCRPVEMFALEPSVVKAIGTLEPRDLVDVNAAVPGIVRSIGDADADGSKDSIKFGSLVRKEDILARLDATSYLAALSQSRADLTRAEAEVALAKSRIALAERELQRAAIHQEGKAENQGDLEVAKAALDVARTAEQAQLAALEQARAAVRRAEIAVDNCTIKSPIDGEVLAIRINTGQAVSANANSPSLFLLMPDRNRLQVWASVDERDIRRIAVGQPARFTIASEPGKSYMGKVSQVRLNAIANQNMVAYTVVIDPDQQDKNLLPYLTANVEIETGKQ